MNQLRTVMWKELRELRAQGSELGPVATTLMVLVILGVVGAMAASAGREAVYTIAPLMIAGIPVMAVMAPICESFAGERERHTLETLLASRVSSEALLIGKILVHVLYSWCGSLLLVTVFVAGANARSITEPWALPQLPIVLIIVALMPLVLLGLSAAGALVSLRSATVRQAVSKLLVLFFSLFISVFIVGKLIPLSRIEAAQRLAATERGQLLGVLACALILAMVDVVLILLAWARFRRDRLIEIR